MASDGPTYSARRSAVFSTGGMICCTQPVAAEMGARILAAGGNAVDAAVAVAAGMALTEPCSNGLGGDAFALYYEASTRKMHALNASGRAPSALTLEAIAADPALAGKTSLPNFHPHTITVPGAVSGWCAALEKWGSLPVARVLAPAIAAAERGFPVSPLTAHHWGEGVKQLQQWQTLNPGCADAAADLMVEGGRGPKPGEVFRNPALAATLRRIAAHGAAGFYTGPIAERIVEAVRSVGGLLSVEDLSSHTVTWPEPISAEVDGYRVWEVPPNGQGIVALIALNILTAVLKDEEKIAAVAAAFKDSSSGSGSSGGDGSADTGATHTGSGLCGMPPVSYHRASTSGASGASGALLPRLASLGHNSAAYLHLVIECLRLAFADARAYVADMDDDSSTSSGSSMSAATVSRLLSPEHAAARAACILPGRAAADVTAGTPLAASDTVSFQVVDAAGNACSWIQSNYMGFGSGLVPRECGFSLQNRGANFSLVSGHPNALAPRKRPYHTIIPAMITRTGDGSLFASYSNMGGFMQPQGHLQLLLNLLAHGADAQAAIDAPRLCISDGTAEGAVDFEAGIPHAVLEALAAAGHKVGRRAVQGWARALFGRAQIIVALPTPSAATASAAATAAAATAAAAAPGGVACGHVLMGGSDGRGDGCAWPVQA